MNKFNIAYIPKYQTKKFVDLAKCYEEKTNNYCLGNNSIPHVTISHFIDESSHLSHVWSRVCKSVLDKNIILTFTKYSKLSFDGTIFWLSLLPEPSNILVKTYNVVTDIITPIRHDKFDPHLTLFNFSCHKLRIDESIADISIKDTFELVLGESDDIGQLRKIIYHYRELD